MSEGPLVASSGGQHESEWTHLLGAAFKHLLIVLAISPAQVGLQPLRRLVGQLDAVLQQADGQGPLQQRRRLGREEQPACRKEGSSEAASMQAGICCSLWNRA